MFTEIPEEGQVGLGLRVLEAGSGGWGRAKRGKGLVETPEPLPAICLQMNRVLLGPLHICNYSGRKILGLARHPGDKAPAPFPALALKRDWAGHVPSLALSFSLF